MSSERLQRWALTAEIIGGVAIIVSLIFVGFEVRQSAKAQRAATVLQLKQSWVDLNLMQAVNPDLREAWVSANNEGFNSLDLPDQYLVQANSLVQIHNWSNAFYQYRVGTLEQEQWDPLLRDMDNCFKNLPHFLIIWGTVEHIFDDEFRELVNSIRPSE